MVKRTLLAYLIAAAMSAAPASAAVIFTDNFNSENGGVGTLNYTGFTNFSVSAGTVDLIGNGFFSFPPATDGHGLYVDLDGSTSDAGVLLSDPLSLSPGDYTLNFQLAGNQRNAGNEIVDLAVYRNSLLFLTGAILVADTQGFGNYSLPFSFAGGDLTFSFANRGGDNIGALLDNVSLSSQAVPEPASVLLFGIGAAFAAYRRRRI